MPRLTKVEELTFRVSDLEHRLHLLEDRLRRIHEAERLVIEVRQRANAIELEMLERGIQPWTAGEIYEIAKRAHTGTN